ncbi:MAG: hypothetical protein BWK80_30065 [Desulfobacteraceae bacterium IS3]|nr:MAG: hypothetical protein BWK80_30065 [Desulfobacteraceae bacterium IS3]
MTEENNKLWLESWQHAEVSLKKIKQDELCNYDYEAHLPAINGMLQWAFDNRTIRMTSGLIEQQKFFMKMRKKQMMNPLFDAAMEIQNFMQKRKWTFCFIGGLAVIRWGEIRMTQDIDLCLLSGFGKEEKYIEEILKSFTPRISDALNFALVNRIMLLYSSNGAAVDLSFGGLPFERQMIDRASLFRYSPNCEVMTCSAEDLIVLKAFADRFKDWADIEGILMRQKNRLDFGYVFEQLTPLCELKESSEIVDKLHRLIQ